MRLHVAFENVEFDQDSTDLIRVKKGNDFKLFILDPVGPLQWATAKRDIVLSVAESLDNLSAEVFASFVGMSEIQLQDDSRDVKFWIAIEVYAPEEAVSAAVNDLGSRPRT
jgi:hypothetical protein